MGSILDGTWNTVCLCVSPPTSKRRKLADQSSAGGLVEPHSIYTHFPELAAWFIPLTMITWTGAIAATARDVILSLTLFTLAIGCTIALSLFASDEEGVRAGIKAAAYFWLVSAILAWWRASVFIIE